MVTNEDISVTEPETPEEPPVDEPPVAVVETEVAALTIDEFRTRFVALVDHARDAGLQPVKIMGASVLSRAFAAVDGFLSGLAGDAERKPPKE